jgi:hypothetical protein
MIIIRNKYRNGDVSLSRKKKKVPSKQITFPAGGVTMKIWKATMWHLLVVAVVSVVALSGSGLAQTRLKGFGKTVKIDILDGFVSAEDVAIEPGTTVIWHNATHRRVSVNFGVGEQVKKACVAPTGFVLRGNVYSAPSLKPGAVASLCFVEPGTYAFTAGYDGAPGGESHEIPRGTITVKKDRNPSS